MDMTAGGARAASEIDGSGDPGSDSWAWTEEETTPIVAVRSVARRRAIAKGRSKDALDWIMSMRMGRGDSTLAAVLEATTRGMERHP